MTTFWHRTALRAGVVLGSAAPPIRAHGRVMDPMMSALVRYARKQPVSMRGDIAALRARYAGLPMLAGLWPEPGVDMTACLAGGRPARLYRTAASSAATLLYFHGGGFLMGGLDSHDRLCRRLAARAGIRVLAVDYRLTPEHPFPAAHDDAAEAFAWARRTLPGPVLLGGDSAGANLAAALALDGTAPLQVLIYPVVDMVHVDGTYPSIQQFADGFLLSAADMAECARLLIPPGCDPDDPRLSMIRADLSRAAPAIIAVAGFDPLRDQGIAYAEALRRAGRPATLLDAPGLVHGFADFAGVVPAARRAVDRVAHAIRDALAHMS